MAKIPYARLRKAQLGMVATFFIMGHAALSTVAWVPEFIDRLGVSFAAWGTIVGLGVIGSILPLLFSTRIIMRFGSRAVVLVGSVSAVGWLVSLAFTSDPLTWYFLNAAFAFSISLMGVAVNSHAVMLQRHIGRNVAGRFHAGWSLGAAAAAFTGGISTTFMQLEWYLIAVGVFTLVGLALSMSLLLPRSSDTDVQEWVRAAPGTKKKTPRLMWLLAIGLFAGVLPEVVIIDWGAVFAREIMGLEAGARALPYSAFAIGMIIGRLSMTRLTKRLHPSELSSWGGYLAAVMMLIGIVFGPTLSAADTGLGLVFIMLFWGMAGLGLAAMAPAFLSAAAHVDGMSSAQVLSRMSLFNAVVSIGAKALMGALATGIGLSLSLLLPVVMALLAAAIAGQVAKLAKRKELDNAYPMTGSIMIIPQADDKG